jgi:hypothetical protein
MADVTSGSRMSFRTGLEQVKDLLRQIRRSEGFPEFDGLIGQCAEKLCAIAPLSGEDRESSLPQVLSRIGIGLAREGRLQTWVCLLARFLQEASARRDLHAIRASTTTVELAASQPSLEAIFQRFKEPQPPRVDALVDLLKILPATSLAAATRLAIRSMPEFLLEPVQEFCRESSAHHCEGLVELAGDPDPVIALFALGVVEGTDDDRVTHLGAVALRHADPAVRLAALRLLGGQPSDKATKLLLERLDRRFKTPLAPDEEVELYRALVATARADVLVRVEERLVAAPASFALRLKALVSSAPEDPVATAIVKELVAQTSLQARDLLRRGTKSRHPAVAKTCRDALAGKD